MLVPVLNAILFMFGFLFFIHIASRICYRSFFIIVFIYNYCIIRENLPNIRRCKLFCAIDVFYS